jgi:UDP-N-acetylglucosamine 4,6-dehydratase
MEAFDGKPVEMGFKYNSGTNTDWLNVAQLRDQIREHVDADFSV